MADTIAVEVVASRPEGLERAELVLTVPATVADALAASGLAVPGDAEVGIYGVRVGRDAALSDRDRVEIYRPILCDPKQMRRQRAARRDSSSAAAGRDRATAAGASTGRRRAG